MDNLKMVAIILMIVIILFGWYFPLVRPEESSASKDAPSKPIASNAHIMITQPDEPKGKIPAHMKGHHLSIEESLARFGLDARFGAGFIHAFAAALSVIILSELGDKTFFIAAIMAMRHSRLVIFTAAMLALILMHVLSALMGYSATVIPRALTYYVSSFLFAVFGLKMLKEGYEMSPDDAKEELEEVQADLTKKDFNEDIETGVITSTASRLVVWRRRVPCLAFMLTEIFLEAFTLTFLAEWGDRSQITTIILAAKGENVLGVILGGSLGHGLCTGLAVVGGKFVAQRISVRSVTIIGGVVFILFALSAFFIGP